MTSPTTSSAGPRRGVRYWALLLLQTVLTVTVVANVLHTFVFPGRGTQYDFAELYNTVRYAFAHGWSHIYDPSYAAVREHSRQAADVVIFSPPPTYWVAVPFAVLPFAIGAPLWSGFLIVLLALSFWWTAPRDPRWMIAYASAVASLYTVGYAIHLGQVAAFVAFSFAASWRLLRSGREELAGLVLALGLVKPHVLILIPFTMLVAARWRFALGWAAGAVFLGIASAAMLGIQGSFEYAHFVLAEGAAFATTYTSQGVISWLVGPAAGPGVAIVLLGARVAAVALCVLAALRIRGRAPTRALVAGLLGSALIALYWHFQDFITLNLAAAMMAATSPRRSSMVFLAWTFAAGSAVVAGTTLVPGPVQVLLWIGCEWSWLTWLAVSHSPVSEPSPSPAEARRPVLPSHQAV